MCLLMHSSADVRSKTLFLRHRRISTSLGRSLRLPGAPTGASIGTVPTLDRAVRLCRTMIDLERKNQVFSIERSSGLPFDAGRCPWLSKDPTIRVRRLGEAKDQVLPQEIE